jgi:hypothetical protein
MPVARPFGEMQMLSEIWHIAGTLGDAYSTEDVFVHLTDSQPEFIPST